LNDFLEEQIRIFEEKASGYEVKKIPVNVLDEVFRKYIK
jgi:hypothetical protein